MTKTPEEIARIRLRECERDILYTLKMAKIGNPYAGEPDSERRRERLQAKTNLNVREAEAVNLEVLRRAHVQMSGGESAAASPARGRPRPAVEVSPDAREKVWGDTTDFVNVAFLERGAQTARSVGRVAHKNGRARGSGVLIGEGLFLTNHHVIETARQAEQFYLEFDYERDLRGGLRDPTRFRLDPTIFITDPVEGLDFTVIGAGDRVDGPESLNAFGFSVLSAARNKHMIGEFANIVQHPRGRFKEVVLRENRLVSRFDDCLHYVADTEAGSSGSPVYNSEWQMIALHHWGGPWIEDREATDRNTFEINEGIRISSIVRKLRNRIRRLPATARGRISNVLDGESGFVPSARQLEIRNSPPTTVSTAISEARIDANGRVTWTLPVEISVRIPGLITEQAVESGISPHAKAAPGKIVSGAEEYSDREGYLRNFLDGFTVPLPELAPGLRDDVATLIDPAPGANPYELKYHHFSVVMNKRRRLAFFTACMIDGRTSKSIGRQSRNVSDLKATDTGLAETVEELNDAEADSWVTDSRLDRGDYSGDEIYKSQRVRGFPNPRSRGRIARMFQKGHLVRRLDPAWGDEIRALEAELDTFHWTNAAPQVGFFNQGTADEDQPGTGRGNLWRAAENYVLRNAVAENQRVISFTGPVFRDDDRAYRHIQIPAQFFKVTVWVESGILRSLALVVDQAQVFDAWPEAIGTPEFLETATEADAFLDADELDRVRDFLSTIEEVEQATELDFGDVVRAADIRVGMDPEEVTSDDNLPLGPDTRLRTAPDRMPGAVDEPDGEPDDLTLVRGIGPALRRLLNRHGIFHFRQIAAWGPDEITAVDTRLRFPGRIERDNWIGQARQLSE